MALAPGLLLVSSGRFAAALVIEGTLVAAAAARGHRRQAAALAALALVLLARADAARRARLEELRAWSAQTPGLLVVEGRAEAVGETGDERLRVLFRVARVGTPGAALEARTGWIRLYVDRGSLPVRATGAGSPPHGRALRVEGAFRPGARAENPGSVPWEELPGGPRVRGWLAVRRWSPVPGAAASPLQRLREGLSGRVAELFPPLSGGFMQAALFGDREALSPRLREVFTRTGTGHIIAISGMNVAILAGVGWAALSPWVRSTRLRRRLLSAGLLLYVPLGGASPSVARAAAMAVALLSAQASARRVRLPNALGFAGLAVLLLQPEALQDPSFQLSFAAVAGLAALPDLPGRRWAATSAGDVRALAAGGGAAPRPIAQPLRALLGGTIDLSIATGVSLVSTLPLTLSYFRHLPLTSLAANLLVVPSLGLLTAGGFAAIVASLAWPALGQLYARACDLLLLFVFRALEACAAPRWAWVALPGPRHALALGGLVVTALSAVALRSPRGRRPAAAALLAIGGLAPLAAARLGGGGILELAVLAVGQGDAIAILPPGGGALLVDGGPARSGEAILAFLHERGVRRLERVIATHPDGDHTAGLAEVLRRLPADSVHDAGQWGAGAPYRRFLEAGVAAGAGYRALRAGDRLRSGELELEVLWPDAGFRARDPYWEAFATNDASLVLVARWAHVRLLLTGDVGGEVERRLAEGAPDAVAADVLKVAHHGSRHSSTPELLAAVAPQVALVSAGRGNRHRHPHPEVLARLRGVGAVVRRTDLEGALLVRCGATACEVRGFSSGRVEHVPARHAEVRFGRP